MPSTAFIQALRVFSYVAIAYTTLSFGLVLIACLRSQLAAAYAVY